MKIRKYYEAKTLEMSLDTGDGQYSAQQIPGSVAAKLVANASTLEADGDSLVINRNIYLPAEAFDFEGEKIPKKSKRPNKKELLQEVKQELTNAELSKAIKEAKESPEKPHFTKNTSTEK